MTGQREKWEFIREGERGGESILNVCFPYLDVCSVTLSDQEMLPLSRRQTLDNSLIINLAVHTQYLQSHIAVHLCNIGKAGFQTSLLRLQDIIHFKK